MYIKTIGEMYTHCIMCFVLSHYLIYLESCKDLHPVWGGKERQREGETDRERQRQKMNRNIIPTGL